MTVSKESNGSDEHSSPKTLQDCVESQSVLESEQEAVNRTGKSHEFEFTNERKYYLDSSIRDPGTLLDANAKNRATTNLFLSTYADKFVRYCTPSEIETFLPFC